MLLADASEAPADVAGGYCRALGNRTRAHRSLPTTCLVQLTLSESNDRQVAPATAAIAEALAHCPGDELFQFSFEEHSRMERTASA